MTNNLLVRLVGTGAMLALLVTAADNVAAEEPSRTTTPIEHVVVIFQENVSFDHYFGTYPVAANPAGEPVFTAAPGTPAVNGLSGALLTSNPNLGNPQRLDPTEALTCDQDHDYTAEQLAADHGAMDAFVQNTGSGLTRAQCDKPKLATPTPTDYASLDYYDGNTVTALWNYAQHFSMSDNSYGTTYGPSTPGALNLVAGNTYPALCGAIVGTTPGSGDPDIYNPNGDVSPCPGGTSTKAPAGSTVGTGTGTVVSDSDPYYDACANPKTTSAQGGQNIGNLLSSNNLTWGFFQGGFSNPGYQPGNPATFNAAAICKGAHYNLGAGAALDGQPCVSHTPAQPVDAFCIADYSPHHEPFQYFQSTSNPQHLPPSSIPMIGSTDQANHQYDLSDFWAAADQGKMPAVSFLKAAKFQDGHAGYSDPLDEQQFLVDTINHLQKLDSWENTAVVVAYDDSDGWYDHVLAPILTQSQTGLDGLTGAGLCGSNPARVPAGQQGRCGLGPRLPLLVISPFAKKNYVDHSVTDQSSIIHFVEDNWKLGGIGSGSVDQSSGSLNGMFNFNDREGGGDDSRLFLNPQTGQKKS